MGPKVKLDDDMELLFADVSTKVGNNNENVIEYFDF